MLKYALLFALAALASLVLTPLVRRLAIRLGAVDQPGNRRVHASPIPRLGGLAVYAALGLTFALALVTSRFAFDVLYGNAPTLAAFGFAATVVMVLGAIDDFRPVSPPVKLATQVVAAFAVVSGGYRIEDVSGISTGVFAVPLTILWVVGITNAFNLIDGLDGLAAGVGLIVSTTLFAVCIQSGHVADAMILASLGGSLLGFLRYNFHPAQIFLGDSGSLLLGFALAVVSIEASNKLSTAVAMTVPILALGLPIIETLLTVLRRLLSALHVVRHVEGSERYEFLFSGRAAVFRADRQHIHHRLLDLGVTHRNAVLFLYGVCAALGAAALGTTLMREPSQGLLLAAFALAAFVGIRRLNYGEMRLLRNGALLPIFDLPLVNRRLLHVLFDLGFIIVSYVGAYCVWFGPRWTVDVRARFAETLPIVALVQLASFTASGLYRRSFRYTGIADLLVMLRALALAVAAGALARVSVRGGASLLDALTIVDGYLLATLVIGARSSFRILEHLFKTDRGGRRRVLVYGAGHWGLLALREIHDDAALEMKVVGFLDDDPRKKMRLLQDCPIYSPDALDELIGGRRFDELVVASKKIPEERIVPVAERCALAGIPVRRFSIGWDVLGRDAEEKPGGAPDVDEAAAAR